MGKKAIFYLFDVIVLVVTILAALASIAGFLASRTDPNQWWLPSLVGLVLIPLLVADAILLLYWAVKRRIWWIIPLAVIVLNVGFIRATIQLPFGKAQEQTAELKIATYNIHRFGKNFRVTAESIAQMMREQGVHVVCLQEFAINNRYNLDSIKIAFYSLPYSYVPVRGEDDKEPGIAVFSSYPIVDSGYIPFDDTENKAMWIDLDVNGRKVRLFNGHLQTTSLSYSWREFARMRRGDAAAFESVYGTLRENACKRADQANIIHGLIRQSPNPVVVCGDFNDTPVSYTYSHIRRGGGLRDAFVEKGRGYGHTFNNIVSILRIDYVLFSQQLKAVSYDSPTYSWSDHNPVIVGLEFKDR